MLCSFSLSLCVWVRYHRWYNVCTEHRHRHTRTQQAKKKNDGCVFNFPFKPNWIFDFRIGKINNLAAINEAAATAHQQRNNKKRKENMKRTSSLSSCIILIMRNRANDIAANNICKWPRAFDCAKLYLWASGLQPKGRSPAMVYNLLILLSQRALQGHDAIEKSDSALPTNWTVNFIGKCHRRSEKKKAKPIKVAIALANESAFDWKVLSPFITNILQNQIK